MLNLLCEGFGRETLILLCLWAVLIPVTTVIWVLMQPDTNHFADKVGKSVMSFQSSVLNIAEYINCVRSQNIVLLWKQEHPQLRKNVECFGLYDKMQHLLCSRGIVQIEMGIARCISEENKRVPLVLCPSL